MTRMHHRRAGFSLIELIVVISIISVLMALSAGAFFRVRSGQMKRASIATVNKVQGALENRVKAIRDSVQDDARLNRGQYPKALLQANNDPDVAKTLLLYAKMKNELPMTFAEATSTTVIGFAPTGGNPDTRIILQQRAHFVSAIGATTSSGSPQESGACLFIALTNSGGDGAAAEGGLDQQALTVSIGTPAKDFRTFADAYGTPLAFVRQCYAPEVQLAPYVRGAMGDPYDPSPTHKAATLLAARWTAVPIQIKPPGITGYVPPGTYQSVANANHVPTVVSAGQNTTFGTDMFGSEDNLYGFRLRREGSTGN